CCYRTWPISCAARTRELPRLPSATVNTFAISPHTSHEATTRPRCTAGGRRATTSALLREAGGAPRASTDDFGGTLEEVNGRFRSGPMGAGRCRHGRHVADARD